MCLARCTYYHISTNHEHGRARYDTVPALGSFYCNQLQYTFGCSTWRPPTCLQHQAREHLEQKQGHQYDTILFHKVYRKSACIQGTRDGRRRRSLYLPRYVCMHLRPGGSPLSWLRTNPRRPTLDFPNGKPQSS